MNILVLFSQPWRVGGAETHVEALLKGLKEQNIVLAVNQGSNEEKLNHLLLECPNAEIVKIQARGINLFAWLKSIYVLLQVIKNKQIDVISAQQRTAGIWAYILSKIASIPFVVTMHDSWHRAVFKRIYARLFPNIIVVSQRLTDVLVKQFSFKPNQIQFINNGIDFGDFSPQDRSHARKTINVNYSDDTPLILHVSRLSRIKGEVALKLLDSMEYILQKNEKCKLIIIGEGPLRTEVEERAKLLNEKYADAVRINNFVADIVNWYNAADIVVGEGRVAIEALACEKPVVAIRNGNYFFGVVNDKNIACAVEVNFDGNTYKVSREILGKEVDGAFELTKEQSKLISHSIRKILSIEKMSERYNNLFKELKKE